MQYTPWMKFTDYSKRIFDFNYQGAEVHLVFKPIFKRRGYKSYVEITWMSDKFPGKKYTFTRPYRYKPDWGPIFVDLKLSLSYGLNPAARPVIDRLRSKDPKKIHHETIISGKASL